MKDIYRVLEKFGLTQNEAKVYLAALQVKESSPYTLSKATGIPRTTVYEIVASLSLKGLVELEKNDGLMKQQTKLRAKEPSVLRHIVHTRQRDLAGLDVDIVSILPRLKKGYVEPVGDADFQFYPGIDGARQVYLGSFAKVDAQVFVWDNMTSMDAFGTKIINQDVDEETKRTRQSHFRRKELFVLSDWTRHVLTYQYGRNKDYLEARELRYLDQPGLKIKQPITIVGDYIRMVSTEEGEAWGLIIHSQTLSQTFRSLFQVTWQVSTLVTEELVKSWGENAYLKVEQKRSLEKIS